MERERAVLLPDGRLHLQHGPIDVLCGAEGPGRDAAFRRAAERFQGVLEDLVAELPSLRTAVTDAPVVTGPVARRMLAATMPFAPLFVTPMAAVAGSVADEIVTAMAGDGLTKAHANNGGDIAFLLGSGQEATAALIAPVPARLAIPATSPVRGVATSGWRGRSHSLGIADSVTVLARTAAMADAAATLIANTVDLPDHPAIRRVPARDLSPDSDLGDRPVTVDVGPLTATERSCALDAGLACAEEFRARGLIEAAFLVLGDQLRQTGPLPVVAHTGETQNA